MVGKSTPEAPRPVLEQTEPRFDEWPISSRLTFALAVQQLQRPVVPRAAAGLYQRTTAVPRENAFEKQQCIETGPTGEISTVRVADLAT